MASVKITLSKDCDEFLNQTARDKELSKKNIILEILEKKVIREAEVSQDFSEKHLPHPKIS